MQKAIYLLISSPFISFILLALVSQIYKKLTAVLGVLGIFLSFIGSLWLGINYFAQEQEQITIFFWHWLPFIFADVAFLIDTLSIQMSLMITFISFLISIFSIQFMWRDDGFKRYFIVINLFVGMMLISILANNMGLMYIGWEGVGLCSYLLIGFWFEHEKNNKAAIKALLTTRVADLFLLSGIIITALSFGTLEYISLFHFLTFNANQNENLINLLTFLFLLGALGKSAQIPFQTWLSDAMVGPTPASALIHAATMVVLGVFLIARTFVFFELSQWLNLIFVLGFLTALFAAFVALFQNDIKKVLAYSTISQIGFMFMALGLKALGPSIFHLLSHAFFKALLFLGAGVIGYSVHEYDMKKLGGLKKDLPWAFYAFLIGGMSLAGLPLITCGFYSKEAILAHLLIDKGMILLSLGFLISLITTIYICKTIFMVFLGDKKEMPLEKPGLLMKIALFSLSLFCLGLQFLPLPSNWQAKNFLANHDLELLLLILSLLSFTFGLSIAWLIFKKKLRVHHLVEKIFYNAFYIDNIYNFILVKPFLFLAKKLSKDIFEKIYYFFVRIIFLLGQYFSYFQSGFLRHYVQALVAIITIIIGIMVAR